MPRPTRSIALQPVEALIEPSEAVRRFARATELLLRAQERRLQAASDAVAKEEGDNTPRRSDHPQ